MRQGILFIFEEKTTYPCQNGKAGLAIFCREKGPGYNILTQKPIPFINGWNMMYFIITAIDNVMATAVATDC